MVELSALQRERVRRSQRVSVALPVLVTSLDPETPYSEHCITFMVNRHGCGLRAPQPIGPKTPVQLDIGPGKRSATAHVVMCTAIRGKKDLWELGIELDVPENLWGFHFPPADWITGKSNEPLRSLDAPTAPPEPESRPVETTSALSPEAAIPPGIELRPVVSSTPGPMATSSAEAIAVATAAAPRAAEVTFSLDEISLAAQPSTPLEIQPLLPPVDTETSPPAPEMMLELEADLRQRARAISAEFEEGYRRSLGELLMRLRADLEEQAASDWERNRQQALESLQAVAEKLREQLERESAARATSDAARAAQLEEVRQARDYVESLIRVLPETIDRRLQEVFSAQAEHWQNRLKEEHVAREHELRAQLQQHSQALADELAAQARQRLFDDLDRHEREFLDRITVRLEEVRASADHTREFTKRASAEIARESEQLRVDLQTQFNSLFEEHRRNLATKLEGRHQQLSQAAHSALQNLGGRLWESFRLRLDADYEARTRELQQTLRTAQAETRRLREHTEKLAARLDIGLQARLDQALEDATSQAQSQFQQLLVAAREEGRRQLQADQEQARTGHVQTQQALEASLQAQRAALLEEFTRESEAIAAKARSSFQRDMRETLECIGEVLGAKPRLPGKNVEQPGAKES